MRLVRFLVGVWLSAPTPRGYAQVDALAKRLADRSRRRWWQRVGVFRESV